MYLHQKQVLWAQVYFCAPGCQFCWWNIEDLSFHRTPSGLKVWIAKDSASNQMPSALTDCYEHEINKGIFAWIWSYGSVVVPMLLCWELEEHLCTFSGSSLCPRPPLCLCWACSDTRIHHPQLSASTINLCLQCLPTTLKELIAPRSSWRKLGNQNRLFTSQACQVALCGCFAWELRVTRCRKV